MNLLHDFAGEVKSARFKSKSTTRDLAVCKTRLKVLELNVQLQTDTAERVVDLLIKLVSKAAEPASTKTFRENKETTLKTIICECSHLYFALE